MFVSKKWEAKDDELMQVLKEHGISEQAPRFPVVLWPNVEKNTDFVKARAQAVAQREAMRKEAWCVP